jgi:hypothetical protein
MAPGVGIQSTYSTFHYYFCILHQGPYKSAKHKENIITTSETIDKRK